MTKDSIDPTKYFIDNEISDFHLLALTDTPDVAREMQVCLRSWFLAYCVEYDDASSDYQGLETDRIIYADLDDMFSRIQDYRLRFVPDMKRYHQIFLTPVEAFSGTDDLLKVKNSVRDWFGAILSKFGERADRLDMTKHTYAYSTINEYLLFFIAQRHQDVLRQFATI